MHKTWSRRASAPGSFATRSRQAVRLTGTAVTAAVVVTGASACAARSSGAGQRIPASTSAVQLAASSWRISESLPGAWLGFTAVAAASQSDAWAFTSNGLKSVVPQAWQLKGSAWTQVAFPGRPGERVDVAAAAGPADAWAFTSRNRAVRWNGTTWRVVSGFPGQNVSGALVLSRRDVWVFDQLYAPGSDHNTWHYNGRRWTRAGTAARGLAGASAVSASDIWAFGAEWSASATVLAHWNGSAWQRQSVAALLPRPTMFCRPDIDAIYAVSASDAWAVGSALCQDVSGPSVLLHYSNGAWRRVAAVGRYTAVGLLPDGHGGLWIPVYAVQVLPGGMLHYSHGTLSAVRLPIAAGHMSLIQAAAAPGGRAAFAVGSRIVRRLPSGAVILRYET